MSFEQNELFEVSTNEVSAAIEGTPLLLGADIVVTGGSGTYTYRWYTERGFLTDQPTLTVGEPGEYYLDVSDQCDCLQTVAFHISGTSGLTQTDAVNFTYGPNPTQGTIHFNTPIPITQVSVFSERGTLCSLFTNRHEIKTVDLSQLPPGNYILHILFADKRLSTHKIIRK